MFSVKAMTDSPITLVKASEVRLGDLVFSQDYPADVLVSIPIDDGHNQLIVWGYDPHDMCVVPAEACVCIVRQS